VRLPRFREEAGEHALRLPQRGVQIVPGELGEGAVALGGATHRFHQLVRGLEKLARRGRSSGLDRLRHEGLWRHVERVEITP